MTFDEWISAAPNLSRDDIRAVRSYLDSEMGRVMKEEREAKLASRLDFFELGVDCEDLVVEFYPGVFSLSVDGYTSGTYRSVDFEREVSSSRAFYLGAFLFYEKAGRLCVRDGEMDLEAGVDFYAFREWVQEVVARHERV